MFHWHFKPFTPPQTFHTLVTHLPACTSQQGSNAAITILALLARQLNHIRDQAFFAGTALRQSTLQARPSKYMMATAIAVGASLMASLCAGVILWRSFRSCWFCIKIARNEWGLRLDTNPADNISLPPSGKPRARRLQGREWEQLQEASNLTRNPHIWPVICFALHSGMRRSEILSLQWANINFEKKLAYLALTKNGTDREVPLTPEALGVLSNQLRYGYEQPFPISENAFRPAWTRLKHRSGINVCQRHFDIIEICQCVRQNYIIKWAIRLYCLMH